VKMTNKVWLSAVIALAVQGTAVHAGALADIYNQALTQDPQLKAAEAGSLAGQEALPQARAGLLPSVSLNGNTTWIETDSAADYNNHGYTVSLSQPIFSASAWFGFKQGQALSKVAQLQYDQAQQSLILRTVESYLDVLQAKSALETRQAEERAIKRRLDQVNAQFEVGLIAVTDVQEAQASYDNAKVARILAEGELDNSFQSVERLIGHGNVTIDPLDADYPVQEIVPNSPESWLEKAQDSNLELKVSEANVDAARRLSQANRSGHLPTLSLTASHDRDNGTVTSNGWKETNQVGLTLSMPLFSGGGTSSKARESEYRYIEAQQNRENSYRAVVQDTRSLLRDLHTDVLSVAARQQSILSSETALNATEEGFNVGTRNVVDVLQAEQQLYSAQRDYASARFTYVLNLFRFKQQIGTLNPDDLIGLDQWMKP